MFELRYVRGCHDYGGSKLQYRFNQLCVDIGGHLCPGDWTDWIDVPTVFLEDEQEQSE